MYSFSSADSFSLKLDVNDDPMDTDDRLPVLGSFILFWWRIFDSSPFALDTLDSRELQAQ